MGNYTAFTTSIIAFYVKRTQDYSVGFSCGSLGVEYAKPLRKLSLCHVAECHLTFSNTRLIYGMILRRYENLKQISSESTNHDNFLVILAGIA